MLSFHILTERFLESRDSTEARRLINTATHASDPIPSVTISEGSSDFSGDSIDINEPRTLSGI